MRFITDRIWKLVFGAIMVLGLYATFVRFTKGLGASTHLSDSFPWGLWIGFDILVGVGLAAGGFVIAATVHIFHLKRYEPIARPTILTAFLGYLLVIFALMFDLGRPYRIWHPLVMGNPHSVMFEVAMCVMLYTTVLALEFSPLILARFKLERPLRVIKSIYIPLVIAGVLLSTLHQSSLGTMYVIVPDKLHGLWYTPMLPVFFFLSAIAGGLAMTIFESFLSARAFQRELEHDLLEGMARVIVVVLAVLLVWKLEDLGARGSLGLIFTMTPESVMFWGEMALGVALPMAIFATRRGRESESWLFFGALLTIMGFIINRLNVAITGMVGASGVNYVPSWMEFAVTMFIVAIGFGLFRLAVQHLEIFPAHAAPAAATVAAGSTQPARPFILRGRPIAAMWALLLVGVVLVGMTGAGRGPAAVATAETPSHSRVVAPSRAEALDGLLIPTHEDSPGTVRFNHSDHVDLRAPDCTACHTRIFSLTAEGFAAREKTWGEDGFHTGCGTCHNGDDAFDYEEDCEVCHEE